jgi:FkbM family methyltransferase
MKYPSFLLDILHNPRVPLRLRKKIVKLCGEPDTGVSFIRPVFSALYAGTTGNHMDDKIYLYGCHEPATIRLMRSILAYQKDTGISPVYLDIGTNTGQHLIGTGSAADAAVGFEPWSVAFDRAQGNIERNALKQVCVMPYGLSDQEAVLSYHPPEGNNLGTGMFVRDNTASPENLSLRVRKGDDVIAELGLRPTLMKIDTEGHEDSVLRGLHATIGACRPAIVFEYSDLSRKALSGAGSRNSLFDDRYSFYGILRSREYPKLEPFNPAKKYENVLAWPEPNLPNTLSF